ncbi:unnamed protein product [Mesocestoides corti]|uniref:Gamma-glutamyltransferase n=1 Tax=Mesocestoides corti TaxID=53468 RepID=A0A0R3U3M8_MESCO|nr:unnamed protein product [Mesocestoides corti]
MGHYFSDNQFHIHPDGAPTLPLNPMRKGFWKYICSSAQQINLIYLGISVCLAAISFALLLTIFFGQPQVTPRGFFISNSGFCSDSGKRIMTDRGGNAADALIAIVLCLSVTRPDAVGLGGCGAFLVHVRDANKNDLFDAMCSSPSAFDVTSQNAAYSVGVPGLLAGLKSVHDAYGYLSWSDLFQPAIDSAEHGFMVHPDLMRIVQKVVNSTPTSHIAHDIEQNVKNGLYPPQPSLAATLRKLATEGVQPFYNGSIGQGIVDEMQKLGVTWVLEGDLSTYQVHKPNHTELDSAGFTIHGFTSPFVGGLLAANVLSNLDMLNHLRPLRSRKLALGEPKEVAQLYHRLIELTKLSLVHVSGLGDPYDPNSGKITVSREDKFMSLETRKSLVSMVSDDRVLSTSALGYVDPTSQDGETFVLTVESDNLIASASLIMGSPFGSGIKTTNTGILLNAAQRLFSSAPPSSTTSLNVPAPGRRPLATTSPIFFETAQQKCGHRFIAASSSGLQGIVGISQVLTSSFLYLSNVTCSGDEQRPPLPSAEETTKTYTPAVGACLPVNASLALKRFTLDFLPVQNSTQHEFVVLLEPGFPSAIKKGLEDLGHKVVATTNPTSVVGAVGWTLYTTIGGVEQSSVNSSSWF